MTNKQDYPKLLSKNGYLSGVVFKDQAGREIHKTFEEYARLIPGAAVTYTEIKHVAKSIIDQDLMLEHP